QTPVLGKLTKDLYFNPSVALTAVVAQVGLAVETFSALVAIGLGDVEQGRCQSVIAAVVLQPDFVLTCFLGREDLAFVGVVVTDDHSLCQTLGIVGVQHPVVTQLPDTGNGGRQCILAVVVALAAFVFGADPLLAQAQRQLIFAIRKRQGIG